jgi:biotin operon repressor
MIPAVQVTVNPFGILTTPVRHTYEKIVGLWQKHGYCWAHNDYLAAELNCTVRTISNHIKTLLDAGLIIWTRVGNERWMYPADFQPISSRFPAASSIAENPKTTTHTTVEPATVSEPKTVVVSPAPPAIPAPALSEEASSRRDALVDQGVTGAVAVELVTTVPLAQIDAQIEALPYRPRRDAAAVLVKSIRGNWTIPAAVDKARGRKQREERDRRDAAKREEAQKDQETAHEAQKAALEALYVDLPPVEQQAVDAAARGRIGSILRLRPSSPAYQASLRVNRLEVLRQRYPHVFVVP